MAGRKSKYANVAEVVETKKNQWDVAIYIRLSKEDEEEKQESNSITSQKALLTEYVCDKNEFVVYDTYVDDGYSGTDFERPGFQRLLKDMRDGKFNTIVVKDLSRLRKKLY